MANIDKVTCAEILRVTGSIREIIARRCGNSRPGCAERKILAAVAKIEEMTIEREEEIEVVCNTTGKFSN